MTQDTTYDLYFNRYARHTKTSLHNAWYERPAMWSLLDTELQGATVLDAGCATGENVARFLQRGATVIAADSSRSMIDYIRSRFQGENVRLLQCDLGFPLDTIEDASVDLVFSSLTMHYIEDWLPTLREFKRILRPHGRLLFSTHHPEMTRDSVADYFAIAQVHDTWTIDGAPMPITFWHRSFQDIINPVLRSGLRLEQIVEPQLIGDVTQLSQFDQTQVLLLRTHPWFVIVDARSD